MKKILLVEDEDFINFRPINRLREKYDVQLAISIDAAIKEVKKIEKYDLIILDIMMGWGPYSDEETDEGLETGWFFYKKELHEAKIKVIIWTRNNDIFSKPWGSNVVEKLLKNDDDDQLVNVVNKQIGE